MIQHDELVKRVSYDQDTGAFSWRNQVGALAKVGYVDDKGYGRMELGGRAYRLHRLAWFYCFGEWPAGHIDHINRDRLDNSLGNLRDIPHRLNQHNQANTPKKSNRSTGYRGVVAVKKRFAARLRINGKVTCLGRFDTPQEAHEAYRRARAIHQEGYVS